MGKIYGMPYYFAGSMLNRSIAIIIRFEPVADSFLWSDINCN